MPVELRKRKAHQVPTAPEPAAKKKSAAGGAGKKAAKSKEAPAKKAEPEKEAKDEPEAKAEDDKADEPEAKKPAVEAPKAKTKVAVGDTIALEGFGGEIQTNDGKKTTLKELVDESKSGVVLFTYPKASTPGCK
jgi:thioredoxin-dependent peroxiredoxin